MSYCENCENEDGPVVLPTASIQIEGDQEVTLAIIEAVASRYERVAHSRIQKAIDAGISKAIDEATGQLCREVIKPEIVKTVEEGWQRTNNYGEATGEKITIRDRISEMLSKKDSYNRNTTWIQQIAQGVIQDHLTRGFKKEVDEATKALRGQLNGLVNGKVSEALKASLGLK